MERIHACGKCGLDFVQTHHNRHYCDTCMALCNQPGCEKSRAANSGKCGMHKSRVARGMPLDAPATRVYYEDDAECSEHDCHEPIHAQGRCTKHYWAAARAGEIRRVYAMQRNARGRNTPDGYRLVPHPERPIAVREHRLAMEALLGRPLLDSETVHHIHGQRDDNLTDGPLVGFRSGRLELWSTGQPYGQYVGDKVAWAVELLELYAPELLAAKPVQLRLVS